MSNGLICGGEARGFTGKRLVAFLLSLATAVALLGAAGLSQASAADSQLTFSLDRGIINLGSTTGVKIVDPDMTPPDKPAKLVASLSDSGTFTAPKTAFTFPVKKVENLATGEAMLPFVDAKIEIKAAAAISGTFNQATGAATMPVPAQATITVYAAGSPASVAKCGVVGFTLNMATTGKLTDPNAVPTPVDYDSAKFAPPSGTGAMVDNWAGLPNSTKDGGTLMDIVCPALDGLIGGPGGLWLSGTATVGGEVVVGPPEKAPQITAAPPAETDATTAEFKFEAGEGELQEVTGFNCRLDQGEWVACNSGTQSYTGLTVGAHTFTVSATNTKGTGPASSANWTVTKVTPPPPPPPAARLAPLRVQPGARAVRRGRAAVFTVRVRNAGGSAATGARVCVNAPNRLVRVRRCVNLNRIAPGATRAARFRVTVNPRARQGRRAVLRFRATAQGVAARNVRATVRIR